MAHPPGKKAAAAALHHAARSPSMDTASSPAKKTVVAPAKNTVPAPANETVAAPAKKRAPASIKETAPELSKKMASAPAKKTASAPAKKMASAPAKKKVTAPLQEDDEATPPPEIWRILVAWLRTAASAARRRALDAFARWAYSTSAAADSCIAGTSSSAPSNQAKSPPPPRNQPGRRRRGVAHLFAAERALHRNEQRAWAEREADRCIPPGPSVSQIVADFQRFDRYLSSDVHEEYIAACSRCNPGAVICAVCYFERACARQVGHADMIEHVREKHKTTTGVTCKDCSAMFLTERHRDLHAAHCHVT